MSPLIRPAAVLAALVFATFSIAACGNDDDDGGDEPQIVSGVQALPDDACEDVEYGGEGEAQVLIASDLPLQGDDGELSEQQNAAIRQELEDVGWKAGQHNVAFQACDDSLEETGEWDEERCEENANDYADNPDVIGVVGTYNSGCAQVMIPILNEAPDGGVAMVSPGNTLICLTEPAKECVDGQPDSLYPSGTRNYARVVPNDAFQAAGLATFVQQRQVRKPFVLYAGDDPRSKGRADTFISAAQSLGLELVGYESWDPEAADYKDLMKRVRLAGADGLVLAGLLEQNGAQVIKDKVAALGPNEGDGAAVQLFAYNEFGQQATIDEAGPDSAGMYVSLPGVLPENLTGDGKVFVDQLKADLGDAPIELWAPYAGEATAVLLSAIAPDPTRAATVDGLTQVEVDKGITGVFTITPTGDPSIAPISFSVAHAKFEFVEEINPPAGLVAAARGASARTN